MNSRPSKKKQLKYATIRLGVMQFVGCNLGEHFANRPQQCETV